MNFEIHGLLLVEILSCFYWRSGSFNCFVLGDRVLRLGRRWSAQLACTGVHLGSEEDVLFEEVLANIQVLLEALAVDSLVSFTVVIRIIFFCFGSVWSY